jgi:NADH:ubiquinone oxidoreductase subunit K
MSIELMFNAVNIALIAFSRYTVPYGMTAVSDVEEEIGLALTNGTALGETALNTLLTGQIFSIFVIAVAAAEVALALGIVIAIYRNRETVDVTTVNLMKG